VLSSCFVWELEALFENLPIPFSFLCLHMIPNLVIIIYFQPLNHAFLCACSIIIDLKQVIIKLF
jgi:hypothetical protein